MNDSNTEVRLDKWLWAARFFKTRSQATQAINGGKVHLDGGRVKPGRAVKIGNELRIHKNQSEYIVRVVQLSGTRGPAKIAQTLYEEAEASIKAREGVMRQRQMMNATHVAPQSRPNKKDRRTLLKTKRVNS